MPHYIIERVVCLVWKNKQLASASFGEIQFWAKTTGNNLVNLRDANGADLLDLRV